MGQNPIPALAYGQSPSLAPVLIQVDADGYVIPSGTTDALLAVPAANAVTNLFERDVIGNKTDTLVEVVGTTASLTAYIKGLLALTLAGGPINSVASGAAVMSNGLTVFNVATGPIQVLSLLSICQTANDGTASTALWEQISTLGTLTGTFSGASASLASAAAGEMLVLQGNTLAAALLLEANGAGITAVPGSVVVQPGAMKLVIGVGSTTGTWKHYLRYAPLAPGAVVTAAF